MLNEKKCAACGKWNQGNNKHCAFCGAPIDPVLIADQQRKKRDEAAKEKRLQNESRFARYLRELEESDAAHHKILYAILNAIFTVYLAILSFFIWLIALISG